MQTAPLVLEYLKVILSAPVVAGVVAMTFIFKFQSGLRGLINRIAHIKFPGGGELSAPQLPPEPAPKGPPLPGPVEEEQPLLPAALTDQQVSAVKELFDAERARAYLWEYRYLNLFLAPVTQEVLEWFGTLTTRTSLAMADALWTSRIPDPEQRRIILAVLEAHHLVQREGELLAITPKGREYLEWKNKI